MAFIRVLPQYLGEETEDTTKIFTQPLTGYSIEL